MKQTKENKKGGREIEQESIWEYTWEALMEIMMDTQR